MNIDLRGLPDFETGDHSAWLAVAQKALGEGSLDRLSRKTIDGIAFPTLAQPSPNKHPLSLRPVATPWTIAQSVTLGDTAAANRIILDHLAHGVGAIELRLPDYGCDANTGNRLLANLKHAFEGVYTDLIHTHLTLFPATHDLFLGITPLLSALRAFSPNATFHFGIDPITFNLAQGRPVSEMQVSASTFANLIGDLDELGAASTAFSSRGQYWHAAGATEVQQIALAISTAVAILDMAPDADSRRAAASRLEFRLVADPNQFATIAKFRAFRQLWALVLESWSLPQSPAFVHAEPAWRSMTRRDPWVNILRSTISTAAAALGGANTITTVPHTALLGTADDDARRLSRNIQSVLLEESNLHVVGDAAAGSGGLETLTDRFAEAAWAEVQLIEREGGLIRSLADGRIQARIAEADAKERKLIAARRLPITGTSTWPLLDEAVPALSGEPDLAAPGPNLTRLAEPWEALRDRSDAALASTGSRPTVFLANLGPVAAFIARNNWTKNLLEAGGIEVRQPDGVVASAEAAVAAFRASGASVVCLCSSDAIYADLATAVATALKAAGVRHVAIAGKGGELEAALREAGADRFIHDGLDMVALLGDLQAVITAR
ncbi:methylmalonyl-CoA mutase family protein [Oryzibacter oryziterrae]|uniref:methylmalonyl-CoA mutase family protein n=1 Tax=Oryzibacter oryziterrae TaxID=2766474 RepID=UPI001F29B20F|nr:methylmalonyl-CoA mutase family protein [Oryzibacter oryziterrae]